MLSHGGERVASMLKELHIQNFAIIEKLSLFFFNRV